MKARIVTLPGDGIGPDVMAQAVNVLTSVACAFGHSFTLLERKIGGVSIEAFGEPLTDKVLADCRQADAVLLGPVGGPQWKQLDPATRPEAGVEALRRGMDLYAQLLPLGANAMLVQGLGGVTLEDAVWSEDMASDCLMASRQAIAHSAVLAFAQAHKRQKRLCSADWGSGPAVSRLWRDTVNRLAADYPEVEVTHLKADKCAARLLRQPDAFDVILTGGPWGDILAAQAETMAEDDAFCARAALGDGLRGLYQPFQSPQTELAGRDMANPLGMILACVMLLRYSLGLDKEADCVEAACRNVIAAGWRTQDMADPGRPAIGCQGLGELICQQIELAGEIIG